MQNVTTDTRVPRTAATVMLIRDDRTGLAVYLTRRSDRSRFMPGAYVFPGGAVDPSDGDERILTRLSGRPPSLRAPIAVAALRELFEEAGILFARQSTGAPAAFAPDELASIRARLLAGVTFADLLDERDLTLDGSALLYYSNWITPASEPIRFDTHFFLARVPAEQVAAADALEVHDGVWLAPQAALERAARGELTIVFPTRKHLERLATFASADEVIAHARARDVGTVRPVELPSGEFSVGPSSDAW